MFHEQKAAESRSKKTAAGLIQYSALTNNQDFAQLHAFNG